MAGSGTGQLLRKAAAADIGLQLHSMFAGIRFGGAQPQTAGALPALVLLTHLAEGGPIEYRRLLGNGKRNQPGTLHPGKANRLR